MHPAAEAAAASRIAGRIHTGLTSYRTRPDVAVKTYQKYLRASNSRLLQPERIDTLDTSDRYLKMARPAFGGNVMATIARRKPPADGDGPSLRNGNAKEGREPHERCRYGRYRTEHGRSERRHRSQQ